MPEVQAPRFVSAAEITRNFGQWQDRAGQGPLIVTHHGRPRVALLAIERYDALIRDEGAELEAARLSALIGHIGLAFMAFDEDDRFVRVNPAAVAQLGLPERSLVGRTAEEALGPGGRALATLVGDARASGEERQADMAAPHGARALRLRLFPYPGGIAVLSRNISGPLSAERSAAAAAVEARARAAGGRSWVTWLDARGMIETIDGGIADLIGFAPQRLVGVRFTDLFSIATRAPLADRIDAVLAGKGAVAADAALLVAGSERPARVGLAERRGDGRVNGLAAFVTA